MKNPKELIKFGVQAAQKKGAQQVGVSLNKSRNVSIDWRDGALEKVEDGTTQTLSFQLFVDGRYSVVSTSDLRTEAVESFLETAVATARVLAKDEFRSLADPKLYQGRPNKDLKLSDPGHASLSPQAKRDMVKAAEEAAKTVRGKEHLLSVSTSFSDSFSEIFRLHSNGFEGYEQTTTFFLSASASAQDKDGKPEEYAYGGSRFMNGVPDPKKVGIEAAERTIGRRGSSKGKSGLYTMVVEPRVAGRLMRMIRGPLSGSSLQQKQSYLDGMMGKEIASKVLNLTDNPHIPSGFGSRLFDSEGITAKKMPVIENGVLRNYYIDTYYGKKLEMAPTTASASNIEFKLGDKNLDKLVKEAGDGILVTSFLGGNSNGLTGDFSLGIQGNIIRNGEVAEPVGEMNLSGNLLDFFKSLAAVGNDPFPYSSLLCPTLVFEKVDIAGT